jgi:putative ABC transport system substrate-binding protein
MITGMSIMGSELLLKRLDLLRQVRPQATGLAYLLNASNPGNPFFISEVKDAADQMGVKVHVFEVKEIAELVGAFRRMTSLGAQGLLIIEDPLFNSNSSTISELALQHQIPTVSGNRDLPAAGGLLAYAFNYIALVKRTAAYVDRILKGEAPGDLPIEQPTEFKLIINLKTAKALGITIPPTLLTRADEVIE